MQTSPSDQLHLLDLDEAVCFLRGAYARRTLQNLAWSKRIRCVGRGERMRFLLLWLLEDRGVTEFNYLPRWNHYSSAAVSSTRQRLLAGRRRCEQVVLERGHKIEPIALKPRSVPHVVFTHNGLHAVFKGQADRDALR